MTVGFENEGGEDFIEARDGYQRGWQVKQW